MQFGFTADPSPCLSTMYEQWLRIQQLVGFLEGQFHRKKDRYEALNILERWLLTLENDPLLKSRNLPALISHPATAKMEQEFVEKRLGNGARLVAGMVKIPPPKIEGQPTPLIIGPILSCGKYHRVLTTERLDLLRKYASDDAIVELGMRYSSLISGAQQWTLSYYDRLVERYGKQFGGRIVEGFASPFNSQLLKFRGQLATLQGVDEKKCAFMGSLFPEDDAFGRIDNFFEICFVDDVGRPRIINCNPPFIESLMLSMADAIDEQLDEHPDATAIVFVPAWTDAEYYVKLSQSKHLRQTIDVPKEHFSMLDTTQGDISIRGYFRATIFVLGTDLDLSWVLGEFLAG